MKDIVGKSILVVLLIIYIYTPVFKVLPISSKIILEIIGLFAVAIYMINHRLRIKRSISWILCFPLLIGLWDFIVCMVNGTSEFVLTKSMVTPIGSIIAAQFLFQISNKIIKNHHDFLMIVIIAVLVESVLTAIMRLIPPVYVFVNMIQIPLTGSTEISDISFYNRFVGIGVAVAFSVLPSVSIGLTSIVYEIHTRKERLRSLLLYVSFILISIVSFFVARTSFFVVALSALLLLDYLMKDGMKSAVIVLFYIVIIALLSYNVVLLYVDETVLQWGLSAFGDKYSDTSSSTGETLLDWFLNTHFDLKTLVFGDGLYMNPNGIGYYGDTDVGYFRRIYYGGIIGLFLIIYYHYKIAVFAYKSMGTKDIKLMMMTLLACFLAILAKGDTLMISELVLFLVFFNNGIFYLPNIKSKELYQKKRIINNI